ncbi:MAG TPA: SDR family NAD(P)-dependent oxidoreductase [Ramlibacter sp.]|nr:SDR family NAD(P)-dependent oxidoreductase [Ramlibacter sp.]
MTSPHLTIITGASRGMGLAMARQLLASGHDLVCMARRSSDELTQTAAQWQRMCEQWPEDLARPENAAARLQGWLQQRGANGVASVTLINNAGAIPQIAPVGDIPARDLADALRVGLEAPVLLTGAFLRATAAWPCDRKVLNISSGLGRRAMASQAAYCAAKAGMDHFTRCVALEEAQRTRGARLCSLAPGVIDTDMQTQLRGASASAFPDRAGFVKLKEQGGLASPEDAATRVLAYLARADFGANPVGDIRD